METMVFLAVVVAVGLLIYHLRLGALQREARRLGLEADAGPAYDQREPWMASARLVHGYVPTSWGHMVRGTVDGCDVRMQAQEIRTSISSNREWHVLVQMRLPGLAAPRFRLELAASAPPLANRVLSSMSMSIRRSLGVNPDEEPHRLIGERWELFGGNDAFFDEQRCARLAELPTGGTIGGVADEVVWFVRSPLSAAQLATLTEAARALIAALVIRPTVPGANDSGPSERRSVPVQPDAAQPPAFSGL